MKKILSLLLLTVLFAGCSSDDDSNDPNPLKTDPDVLATESLKGQSFYSFIRTENDYSGKEPTTYDVYRIFSFTSDKDVVEHTAKGSVDGDTLFKNIGTYAYTHPDLQIKINQDGFSTGNAIVIMNNERNEFKFLGKTFKKK